MTQSRGPVSGDIAAETEKIIEEFLHRAELPHTRISWLLDGGIRVLGDAASWLWAILVGIIVINVTMRYVFGEGRIEFEELQWHIYAIGFLVGFSYCVQNDSHIRIDVVSERLGQRTRAWIELFGLVVFLLPYVIVILVYAVPFIRYSFATGEVSDAPGGLPYRWFIKSFMFIGFALLLVAAVSRITRVTALLFGIPAPVRRAEG